ncbi:MAG: DUF4416 family protein [Nitrospirota bacterium]
MSKVRDNPLPVKIFVGMVSSDAALFEEVGVKLKEMLGDSDLISPAWKWDHTNYYLKEMGVDLKRQFIFFKRLADPGIMPDLKLKTIDIENKYLNSYGGRKINLDPGYLDSARVLLVSGKDFSHRVYIGKGIYGEVTLVYLGNDYQILPYTYPDFKFKEYQDLFKKARRLYQSELESLKSNNIA